MVPLRLIIHCAPRDHRTDLVNANGLDQMTVQARARTSRCFEDAVAVAISRDGLATNIVSFNLGVASGQMPGLTAVLIAISLWRSRPGFLRHSFAANTVI